MDIQLKTDEKFTIVNDPFKKSMVSMVSMHYLSQKWMGKIEFKNGNTEGAQRFEEKDFESLVLKMKHFIENI